MSVEQDEDSVLLRCDHLVIGHGGRALLPPCDLDIRRGNMVMVVGRNGSGKSTFFRTVLGLLPPVGGGVMRLAPRLRFAYVGQATSLDPLLPVCARDLVAWGRLGGWGFLRPTGGRRSRDACERALADAGAADLGDRPFRDLSEGEKQRVLLARMLAAEPDVAVLDEPTAAMDPVAEKQALAHLAGLARERGMAVIVISHVLALALHFADEVVFLDRDDGVIASGAPQVVFAHPTFRRQFGTLEPRSPPVGVGNDKHGA